MKKYLYEIAHPKLGKIWTDISRSNENEFFVNPGIWVKKTECTVVLKNTENGYEMIYPEPWSPKKNGKETIRYSSVNDILKSLKISDTKIIEFNRFILKENISFNKDGFIHAYNNYLNDNDANKLCNSDFNTIVVKTDYKFIHPDTGKLWEAHDTKKFNIVVKSDAGGVEYNTLIDRVMNGVDTCESLTEQYKKSQKSRKIRELATPDQNLDCMMARKIVEAIRLGGVPYDLAPYFTYGREHEIESLADWLDNPESGSFSLVGEYGVGKSHLMDVIVSVALKAGWVVSKIEIDNAESSFDRPRNIYQNIMKSIVAIGEDHNEISLTDLLNLVAKKGSPEILQHSYLRNISGRYGRWDIQDISGDRNEALINWISGNAPPKVIRDFSKPYIFDLPAIHEYGTASNEITYLLSGLSWAFKNIGYRGLLVLFDEAECINPSYYTQQKFKNAANFMSSLIAVTEIKELCVSDYMTEEKYDLFKCGRGPQYPFRFKPDESLKILFSLVPWIFDRLGGCDWNTETLVEFLSEMPKIELDSLSKDDLDKVFEKLREIYLIAYPESEIKSLSLQDILQDDSDSGDSTRMFLKTIIEAFDIIQYNPDFDFSTYWDDDNDDWDGNDDDENDDKMKPTYWISFKR